MNVMLKHARVRNLTGNIDNQHLTTMSIQIFLTKNIRLTVLIYL